MLGETLPHSPSLDVGPLGTNWHFVSETDILNLQSCRGIQTPGMAGRLYSLHENKGDNFHSNLKTISVKGKTVMENKYPSFGHNVKLRWCI